MPILVRKSKNVTITLQQYRENPLKISFGFQTGDKIVIYVSTRGIEIVPPFSTAVQPSASPKVIQKCFIRYAPIQDYWKVK